MKLIRKNNKKGFTLVELVVVIAILAILALILLPAISSYTEKAKISSLEASARALHTTAVMHIAEEGLDGAKANNKLYNALEKEVGEKFKIDNFSVTNPTDGTYQFELSDRSTPANTVKVNQTGIVKQFE